MTVLEQRFMETVPLYLKMIAEELKKLNENLYDNENSSSESRG